MICKECGKECEPIRVNFGRGYSEYAGAPGWHDNWQDASPCCEAEVVEDDYFDDVEEEREREVIANV